MPQIRNVSAYGLLDCPLLQRGDELVEFGEVVDVTDEQATLLLAQFDNWAPVDKPAIAICGDVIVDQIERELEATGEPDHDANKPEWVTFALTKGDPDPAAKTKAQLIDLYGTSVPSPTETAAAMAQRGEDLASGADPLELPVPTPTNPPSDEPAGPPVVVDPNPPTGNGDQQ